MRIQKTSATGRKAVRGWVAGGALAVVLTVSAAIESGHRAVDLLERVRALLTEPCTTTCEEPKK